jgi:hypothetical protein
VLFLAPPKRKIPGWPWRTIIIVKLFFKISVQIFM